MRTHPLLARLALPAGAAFRCAERLESREGLAARFAPDLGAGPLVAEDRLRRLVEPPDGSAALQRALNRAVAPAAVREEGEGAVAEWLPASRNLVGPESTSGEALTDRPVLRPARRGGQAPRASRPSVGSGISGAPIAPPALEVIQAILDGAAPGFSPSGRPGTEREAGPRSGAEARAARPRQAPSGGGQAGDAAPLGRVGGDSFLLRRAAETPVLIDEPEAPASGLFAASAASAASPAPAAPSARRATLPPRGEPSRTAPLGAPEGFAPSEDRDRPSAPPSPPGSPELAQVPRDPRALPAPSPALSAGGFRGLAALAATSAGGPTPLPLSPRFDTPVGSSDASPALRRPQVERLGFSGDGRLAPWAAAASADSGANLGAGHGPISADLEAALDHALRRAARRHGIEVSEP